MHVPALLVGADPVRAGQARAVLAQLLDAYRATRRLSGRIRRGEGVLPGEAAGADRQPSAGKRREAPIDGATCRMHVDVRPDQDTGCGLVVRNSGTVACTPPGHGLEALNDKLRPFGG